MVGTPQIPPKKIIFLYYEHYHSKVLRSVFFKRLLFIIHIKLIKKAFREKTFMLKNISILT